MNRIHRTVWNARLGAFVAVAETTRRQGRQPGAGVVGAALAAGVIGLLCGTSARAAPPPPATLPNGGTVSAGAATLSTAGQTLTVHQQTQRAAINWQTFSIGKDAQVHFVQPNAAAVALNRVTGTEQSVIAGALKANGQVFLLNPNGVLFAAGSRVDTAGLVASTRHLSDSDFMAGRATFTGQGAGDIVNHGQLQAAEGGYVALIGRQVRNDGVVSARLGTVAMAAGDRVSLNFDGASLVGVTVDTGALQALVRNGGAVVADGGTVLLKAKAAESLLDTVVNNTGEIRARSVGEKNGRIYLLGEGGSVEVAGRLDASNAGTGGGGFIETSGPNVAVKAGATVTTAAASGRSGTWLIDPTDFDISAGAGTQSASGIGATTLQNALAAGNVVIQTQSTGSAAGNINVNAPVAWNANKLTLEAHGDINVNAVMSATGTSMLDLKTGYNFNPGSPVFDLTKTVRMKLQTDGSGNPVFVGRVDIDRAGTGLLTINNEGYTLVNQLGNAGDQLSPNGTLQGLDVFTNYALAADIDASSTAGWNSGAGFVPIADNYYPYVGKFNGLGHAITGLKIYQPAERHVALYQVGLFGLADNASFTNLALRNVDMTGSGQVGGLLGGTINNPSTVANVTVSGSVTATNSAGGTGSLAGGVIGVVNNASTVLDNVHSTATVIASSDRAGGLVGAADHTTISRSSSTGDVTGTNYTGGLVGAMFGGTITASSAGGTVTGAGSTGGLVGTGQGGVTITGSTASGNVTGQNGVGGLVGVLDSQAQGNGISGSSATGTVVGNENVGGLLGDSPYAGTTIDRSFATGPVTGVRFLGGFIGTGNAIITDAYATGNVAATDATNGYAGGFAGGGFGTLVLNRVYASGVVSAADLGNAFGSGGLSGFGFYSVNNSFYDATRNPNGAATGYGIGKTTAEMRDSATYLAAGWDFSFVTGVWGRKDSLNNGTPVLRSFGFTDSIVVNLGVTGREYGDANPSLAGVTFLGCPMVNCAGLISVAWGTALDGTTNVGSYQLSGANVLSYTFGNGATAANFDITYAVPTFNITPRTLTVTSVAGATRVYDGTANATAGLFTLGNVVNGDSVTLGGTAQLDSVHAGTRGIASGSGLTISNVNYQLAGAVTGTVAVTPRDLTLTAVTGATRQYDGTSAADAALFALQNVLAGDSVGLSGSAVLDSVHAGSRSVAGNGSLALDNSDYVLAGAAATGNVTVTPRAVTLTPASGATRVYDGTADAGAGLFSLANVVAGDAVTLSGSALLDSAHAGNRGIAGYGSLALNNGDYVLATSAVTGTVAVTPRDLSLSFLTGATRPFDGTAAASSSLFAVGGLLGADTTSLSGNAVLDSADAGARSVVNLGTLALSNGDYRLASQLPTGTLTVTPPTVPPEPPVLDTRLVQEIAAAQRTAVLPPLPVRAVEAGTTTSLSVSAASSNVVAPPGGVATTLGQGVPLLLLSAPGTDEPTEAVTLSQARRMVGAPGGAAAGGSQEVRVPVSRNSLAEIVNGGVRLPGGVDQVLFVVKAAPQ